MFPQRLREENVLIIAFFLAWNNLEGQKTIYSYHSQNWNEYAGNLFNISLKIKKMLKCSQFWEKFLTGNKIKNNIFNRLFFTANNIHALNQIMG